MDLIQPHGGRLVERLVRGAERDQLIHQGRRMQAITLDEWEMSELELFAVGALSPLEGFLRENDYDSVVDRMQLVDGTVWPLPVTLALAQWEADVWREGQDLALKSPDGELAAILHQPELFPYNRAVEAKLLYGTTNLGHPGVKRLMAQGPYYIGGKVSVVNLPKHTDFLPYRLTPAQTRAEFQRRGWRQVIGFQTRNPIHRAHEYLLRCGLEFADGIMLHPLVGKSADDDLPAVVRMRCYETLVGSYLPKDRTLLVANPAPPRTAGPREAIFQAILRQNYGCSLFLIGRDQAGPGKLYGTTDAQKILDRFPRERLEVTPLCFDNAFFCRACEGMATSKTCAHPASERVSVSGAAVRQMLSDGKAPPPEFTRPEIAVILKEATIG